MFRELLIERTAIFCQLTSEQAEQLEQHYKLMLQWNKVMNLTRIESPAEAVDRHYAESLFLASHLPDGPLKIADVGSGAGFPGFPVAIFRPDSQITLIESHKRKAVFLKEVSRDVPNIRVHAIRAEEEREQFDWVVSRAVSWDDLQKHAKVLAPHVALLSSVPYAEGRVIQVPHDVSRETSLLVIA